MCACFKLGTCSSTGTMFEASIILHIFGLPLRLVCVMMLSFVELYKPAMVSRKWLNASAAASAPGIEEAGQPLGRAPIASSDRSGSSRPA